MIKPLPQKRTEYIAPPDLIKKLTAGLSVSMSDSFWLRANQDFDFCDTPVNQQECFGKSWLFQIINTVVDLDNKFYEAFYYGALALTVIISDYAGASVIFDKAVGYYPEKWNLLYNAGYHALIEEKNKVKAAKLYYAASKYGAPEWVSMMAGKLAADGGDLDYAEQILKGMIEFNQEPAYVKRLKEKLEQKKKAN